MFQKYYHASECKTTNVAFIYVFNCLQVNRQISDNYLTVAPQLEPESIAEMTNQDRLIIEERASNTEVPKVSFFLCYVAFV